jgi:hypothetical protein
VGYRYGLAAEIVCPQCLYAQLADVDVTTQPYQSTEELLDRRAAQWGIRRHDETSFRAREFPKPIYLDEAHETDDCVYCGMLLLDQAEE